MSRPAAARPAAANPRSTVDHPAAHRTDRLPALIPIPDAARLLGLSRASAYRYAAAGELPTKRFGRRVYVITNQIRDLLADADAGAPEEAA